MSEGLCYSIASIKQTSIMTTDFISLFVIYLMTLLVAQTTY